MNDEYMCPFCVTPWKCNGPHIEPEDMAEFEAYSLSQYNLGFRDALDAAEAAVKAIPAPRYCDEDWGNAIDEALVAIRALKEKNND